MKKYSLNDISRFIRLGFDSGPLSYSIACAKTLNLIYVNRKFTELTGYQAHEVLGRNCRFLQGVNTEHEALEQIRAALKKEQSVSVTLTNYKKSGEAFSNYLTVTPVFDSTGDCVCFIGIQQDIAVNFAQKQHLLGNQNLSQLGITEFIGPPVAQCHLDETGLILKATQAHTPKLRQILPKTLTGVPLSTIVYLPEFTLEQAYQAQQLHSVVLLSTPPYRLLGRFLKSLEGGRFEIYAMSDFDSQSQTNGFIHQLVRKKSLVARYGGVCFWEWHAGTNQLSWDEGMYQLYGISLGTQVNYQVWRSAVHPEDITECEKAIFTAIQTLSPLQIEFRICNASTGKIRYVRSYAEPVLDSITEQVSLVGLNIDITTEATAIKHLEEQAQQEKASNEFKSRFITTMSHELRTPMNGIIGMLEMLEMGEGDQTRLFDSIKSSSQLLLSIINDILDISKIESGMMSLSYRQTNLSDVLDNCLNSLATLSAKKNVHLLVNKDFSHHLEVMADPHRLEQVIYNLVGNAIKFSKSTGLRLILLDVTLNNGRVYLTVEDNGVGMTPEETKQLFTRFYQADSSSTRQFGGTGLGLAITKSLLTLMGGQIAVTSQKGLGTRFNVSLPMQIKSKAKSVTRIGKPTHYQLALHDVVQLDNYTMELLCDFFDISGFVTESDPHDVLIAFDACPLTVSAPLNVLCHGQVIYQSKEKSATSPYLDIKEFRRFLESPDKAFAKATTVQNLAVSEEHKAAPQQSAPELNGEQAQTMAPVTSNQGSEPLCIVVEDQAMNRDILAMQLGKLKQAHKIFSHAKQALKFYQSQHANVCMVLTDCQMPEMDGYDLCHEIRRFEQAKQISRVPVVAITADATHENGKKCLTKGMDGYLFKPIAFAELTKVLLVFKDLFDHPVDMITLIHHLDRFDFALIEKTLESACQKLEEHHQVLAASHAFPERVSETLSAVITLATQLGIRQLKRLSPEPQHSPHALTQIPQVVSDIRQFIQLMNIS